MKVLLTGGSGNLGQTLVPKLLDQGGHAGHSRCLGAAGFEKGSPCLSRGPFSTPVEAQGPGPPLPRCFSGPAFRYRSASRRPKPLAKVANHAAKKNEKHGGALLLLGGRHPLRHLDADFLPFIDQPSADIFIGLIDIAVQQLEAEPFGVGLFQQLFRFGARLLDIGARSRRIPLQSVLGGGQRRARKRRCRRRYARRQLWTERVCRAQAVDCQGQRPPHSHVVKRLPLVVCLDAAALESPRPRRG